MHHSCTTVRTMRIQHSTMSLRTGESTPGAVEWVTRPCGVPMFGKDERARGTCSACHGGWKHPNNYPANEDPPVFEINPSRTDHGTIDDDTGRPILRPRYVVHQGAAYWLEPGIVGPVLVAAAMVPHPAMPTMLRPDWDSDFEVEPEFTEYEAIAAALA